MGAMRAADIAPHQICADVRQQQLPCWHVEDAQTAGPKSVGCTEQQVEGEAHLEFSGMDTIVAGNEGVPQIVDAELLQAIQRPILKVQVVGVSAPSERCSVKG